MQLVRIIEILPKSNRPEPEISINPSKRTILVKWKDHSTEEFHYVWLRHSGRCSHGMVNDTAVKIDLVPDDPTSLCIKQIVVKDDMLVIQWQDDGIVTEHGLEMLYRSCYSVQARAQRRCKPVLWSHDTEKNIPRFDFKLLANEVNQVKLLCAVRDFGLVKLHGVPVEPGSIANVAQLFGPIHVNNYGRIFDVKTDTQITLGSNTGVYLGPHTDESYRHAPPGISFFHCLQSSNSGGNSILVDGYNAAEKLRQEDPDAFKTLSSVPVFFQRYALPEEDMQSHGRIIVTDLDGEIEGIRFTDRTLPPQDIPGELVEPLYRAIKAFWRIINRPEMTYIYHMLPGDLHIFDNHRVLHGRTEFNPGSNVRHLQQCSVNRDEFHNTLRVMAARLGLSDRYQTLSGGANG